MYRLVRMPGVILSRPLGSSYFEKGAWSAIMKRFMRCTGSSFLRYFACNKGPAVTHTAHLVL